MSPCTDLPRIALALLLGVALPGLGAQDPAPQPDRAAEAARAEARKAAKAALKQASALGRVPRAVKGDERRNRLEQAVAAYATVMARYAEQADLAAEAGFRQGQLLGRLTRYDEARRAYRQASRTDAGRFGARALYEAGNLERRLKRYDEALACYREAAAFAQAGPGAAPVTKDNARYATRARLWTGVALESLGRKPEAREAWTALGRDEAADPGVRIQAFDRMARSYLAEDAPDQARAVLDDADARIGPLCRGETKAEVDLRRRLASMSARKALARALEEDGDDEDDGGDDEDGGRGR
ncbi:MAG: tetratricopeptide repeat protein [Planctomycetota bacterium]